MKRNLIVEDIINCTNGELVLGNRDFECKGFTTDTRKINKDDVYIGIKGERSDGNMLWEEAFQKGARVVIVQNINFENENGRRGGLHHPLRRHGGCADRTQARH